MLRLTLAAIALANLASAAQAAQDMPVVRLVGPHGPDGGQATAPQPPASGRQAPHPDVQLPLRPVTEIAGASAMALDTPRHLRLTSGEPRRIDEVLHLIVAGTPLSLAIDSDVHGEFRGELRDLTLRDALTTLLVPLGLDFSVEGSVVHVMRQRAVTRQFDLNVLDLRRELLRTTGGVPTALTTTVPAEDVLASIGDGVQSLLSNTGRVHIDRRAGLAIVTDVPERLDRVALYLETLETRSAREVRLQAQAFEVTLSAGSSIDWRAVREHLGVGPEAPLDGLAGDLNALRAALGLQGDLRTIWSPEVTTINNEPALMRIDTPGVVSLTLTVVPQISTDGVIQLAVSHSWQDQAESRDAPTGKSTATPRVAESDTVTRLTSGSAVLLSGLLHPVQTPKQGGSAEFVVVLRPTIVTTGTRN